MFIRVKAKKGRIAYTAPRGGELIPSDRYIEVDHTNWIDRLLKVQEDIIQEPEPKKAAPDAPASAPAAEKPKS